MLDATNIAELQQYALTHPCAQAGSMLGPRHFLDTRLSRFTAAGIRVALSLNK